MSDRLDSSPSRLEAQLSFMDQCFDFDGASTGQEGDWSPFETNRALDTSSIGLSTNVNPVNATVAPATGTTPSTMTQSPDFGFVGNAFDNALAINPAQLQGVPHTGNALDTITHFPSGQFLDNFAMASDGHSSFDLAQMGYMQTPWNLAPLFSGNETVTSQSISVPSQLHHPNLVDGSSAGALAADRSQAASSGPDNRHGCHFTGCEKSFKRHTDLQRHIKSIHLKEQYWCHVAGCDRAINGDNPFNRKDKRDEHVRKMHKDDAH